MGVAYDIMLKIQEHGNDEITSIEIAFWQDCNSLSDVLQQFLTTKGADYIISQKNDVEIFCNPEILPLLISELANRISNLDDYAWKESRYSKAYVRAITCKNLEKICLISDTFNSKENELSAWTVVSAAKILGIDETVLYSILNNRESFEITVVFSYSY